MTMDKLRALLKIAEAQHKKAFVDPATAASGGGAPPMDPSMGGGMPMDPSMGGGMPPDPSMGGGGMPPGAPPPPGGVTAEEVRAIVQEAMGSVGGAGAGPGGGLKPKIDVNVEIMQMKNLLSKIVDALGIPVPTQDMVATPEKLTAMASGQDPSTAAMGGGGGGGGGGSAIPPIEPMQGASPGLAQGKTATDGYAYDGLRPGQLSGKAAALVEVLRRRREER